METLVGNDMTITEKILMLATFLGFMFTIFGYAGWLGKYSKRFGFLALIILFTSYISGSLLIQENNKLRHKSHSVKSGVLLKVWTKNYGSETNRDIHYFVRIQGSIDGEWVNRDLEVSKTSFEKFSIGTPVEIVFPEKYYSLIEIEP